MNIIISELPSKNWWGEGIPNYPDNIAMQPGIVPNQKVLNYERKHLINILKNNDVKIIETKYPKTLNGKTPNHDFVFIRDQFISDLNGNVIILNIRQQNRVDETSFVYKILENLNINIIEMPKNKKMYAEGGEFYFCEKESLLFSGLNRNSIKGAEKIAELMNVEELITIKTNAFHLDTIFSPVFNSLNQLCAIIICLELVEYKSKLDLLNWVKNKGITLLDIDPEDSIGYKSNLGSLAVNSLPLPGILISPNSFSNSNVKKELKKLKIKSIISPTSQYMLSGGSIHCITNQI